MPSVLNLKTEEIDTKEKRERYTVSVVGCKQKGILSLLAEGSEEEKARLQSDLTAYNILALDIMRWVFSCRSVEYCNAVMKEDAFLSECFSRWDSIVDKISEKLRED